MVTKDLSDLPTPERQEGNPPVAFPMFVSAIADNWYDQYLERGDHMRSKSNEALPYRASFSAFRCDRQLYYAMAGEPRELPSLADAYRMSLGTLVHSGLESAIKASFENAEFEVEVDLQKIGVPGSAHADIVTYHNYAEGNVDAVVEVKTVNGFGFKSMATDFKGPAQGPRSGHIIQAALSAMALDADRVVIAYLAMESMSPGLARYTQGELGRFAAEWHYTKDEYTAIATAEAARIRRLAAYLDEYKDQDVVPSTFIFEDGVPSGAYVSDPSRGLWVLNDTNDPNLIVDTGKVWFCDYCDWRDKCVVQNTPKS
jgi:hypothetical protein